MGNCTKCGYPNEYGAETPTSKHSGSNDKDVNPWANMTPTGRSLAADEHRGYRCLKCNHLWGDHRHKDWHCPSSDDFSFSDTQWFVRDPNSIT